MSYESPHTEIAVDELKQEAMIRGFEVMLKAIPDDQVPKILVTRIQEVDLVQNPLDLVEILEYLDELSILLDFSPQEKALLAKIRQKIFEAYDMLIKKEEEEGYDQYPIMQQSARPKSLQERWASLAKGCQYGIMLFQDYYESQEANKAVLLNNIQNQIQNELDRLVNYNLNDQKGGDFSRKYGATGKFDRTVLEGEKTTTQLDEKRLKKELDGLFNEMLTDGEKQEQSDESDQNPQSGEQIPVAQEVVLEPVLLTVAVESAEEVPEFTLRKNPFRYFILSFGVLTVLTVMAATIDHSDGDSLVTPTPSKNAATSGPSKQDHISEDDDASRKEQLTKLHADGMALVAYIYRNTTAEERERSIQSAQQAANAGNDPQGNLAQWQELQRNGALFERVMNAILNEETTPTDEEIRQSLSAFTSGGYTSTEIAGFIQECEDNPNLPNSEEYGRGWRAHHERIQRIVNETLKIAVRARDISKR